MFQMFMFQPISPMVAEFYNTSDEVIIWLAQMSLVIFVVVLFPVAFLSDAVSVRRFGMLHTIGYLYTREI